MSEKFIGSEQFNTISGFFNKLLVLKASRKKTQFSNEKINCLFYEIKRKV